MDADPALEGVKLTSAPYASAGSTNGSMVMYGTVGQGVVGTSVNGTSILRHGFWSFGGSRVVAVDPPPTGSELPRELSFGRPTPNPSRGGVRFALALPKSAGVSLRIYDALGREVKRVTPGDLVAGHHTLRWDGANAAGQAAGSGMYFARLVVNGHLMASRRIIMLRSQR